MLQNVCLNLLKFLFEGVLNVIDGLRVLPLVVACCNLFDNVVDRNLSFYLVSRCVGPFRLFQDVWRCAGLSSVDSDHQFVFGFLNLCFSLCSFDSGCVFFVVFGSFAMCFAFFLEAVGLFYLVFCLVFGRFIFLWIGFGFRGCFRLFMVVSGFRVCEVSFALSCAFCGWLWVVVGGCR